MFFFSRSPWRFPFPGRSAGPQRRLQQLYEGTRVGLGQAEEDVGRGGGRRHVREGTPGTWQLRAMRLYAYMPLARDSHLTFSPAL